MARLWLIPTMCIAFVLAGCEVDTGPHRVATLRHPGLALVMPAPYDGRYILYRLVRFPPGLTTHDYVDAMHLQHGEALVFGTGRRGWWPLPEAPRFRCFQAGTTTG